MGKNIKIRTRNKQLSKLFINRLTIDCNDQFEVLPILKTETISRPQKGLKSVLDNYIPAMEEDQIKSINILNFTNDKSSSIITREICKKELAYIKSPFLYFNNFILEQSIAATDKRIIRYKKLHQLKTDETEISHDIEIWIKNIKKSLNKSTYDFYNSTCIDSKSCLVEKRNMLAKGWLRISGKIKGSSGCL